MKRVAIRRLATQPIPSESKSIQGINPAYKKGMIMKSLILVLGLLSVSFTGCASRKAWYEKGLKEGTAQLEAAKAESYQKGYKEGFQDGVRSSSNNNNNIIVVPKGVN
jgi:hypothetical protein